MSFAFDDIDTSFDPGQDVHHQRLTPTGNRYHPYANPQRRRDFESPPVPGSLFQTQGSRRGSSGVPSSSWSLPDSDEQQQQQQLSHMGRAYQSHMEPTGHSCTPVEVEVLAGRLKLNPASRATLHNFNELSSSAQTLALFAHILELRQGQAATADHIAQNTTKLDLMQKLHVEVFKPTDFSTKHMRRMTKHFLIQPLQNYLQLHGATQNYYMRKPSTFRIPTYKTDNGVRDAVDVLLVKFAGQARSNYRKIIWKFVAQGASLDVWADFIMRHYHFHGSAKVPEASEMIKARIALMRQVALPLVALPTAKGQNTSFWDKMRVKLVELYQQHGPDLGSDAWKAWAKGIVTADTAAYTAQTVDLPEDEGLGGEGPAGDGAEESAASTSTGGDDGSGLDPEDDA